MTSFISSLQGSVKGLEDPCPFALLYASSHEKCFKCITFACLTCFSEIVVSGTKSYVPDLNGGAAVPLI